VLVDVVTARAVAPLGKLAGWALPLIAPGGRLLALKGEQADSELAQAGAALRAAGSAGASVVQVGHEELGTFARIVVVERGTATAATSSPKKGAQQQVAHRGHIQRGRR
jgi:16S rRNA (guanine527-N7)-methyltransferase